MRLGPTCGVRLTASMLTHIIKFKRTKAPIRETVTKFGGNPVWKKERQWPIATRTGAPMQFIAQIALEPLGFPGKMAYLFMEGEGGAGDTWEPEGGANALIIQPSDVAPPVQTKQLTDGKRLFELKPLPQGNVRQKQECEYAVTLREEPDTELDDNDDGCRNKIGGLPKWLKEDETPGDGEWLLLLQLDSSGVPFEIDFGESGVGYAFISADGKRGKFLWQSV